MAGRATGPTRTCVGCGRARPSDELARVAVLPDGRLAVGRSLSGRGAWLCGETAAACAVLAQRRRRWSRALRRQVDEVAVAALVDDLAGGAG